MNLFFLDYETNGLNPYYNDVIEVAIKQLDGDHYYQTMIKPDIISTRTRSGGIHHYVSSRITSITGITNKLINEEGISTEQSTTETVQYIQGHSSDDESPIYIVSHNGTVFDFLFLKRLLKKIITESNCYDSARARLLIERYRFIDTCLLAKLYLKDERVNQPGLCKRYNITNDSAHRALGDVNALEKLYRVMCEQYSIQEGQSKDYYLTHPDKLCDDLMT